MVSVESAPAAGGRSSSVLRGGARCSTRRRLEQQGCSALESHGGVLTVRHRRPKDLSDPSGPARRSSLPQIVRSPDESLSSNAQTRIDVLNQLVELYIPFGIVTHAQQSHPGTQAPPLAEGHPGKHSPLHTHERVTAQSRGDFGSASEP